MVGERHWVSRFCNRSLLAWRWQLVNANDVIANKMNNIPYLQPSRRVHTRSNQGNFWNGKDRVCTSACKVRAKVIFGNY